MLTALQDTRGLANRFHTGITGDSLKDWIDILDRTFGIGDYYCLARLLNC